MRFTAASRVPTNSTHARGNFTLPPSSTISDFMTRATIQIDSGSSCVDPDADTSPSPHSHPWRPWPHSAFGFQLDASTKP